jgi:hypothetical protein
VWGVDELVFGVRQRRICEEEHAKVDHVTPVGRQGVKCLEAHFSHACMNTVHEIICNATAGKETRGVGQTPKHGMG